MTGTIKGGDLVYAPDLEGYFVRAHSRSKVFFPVKHDGNRPLAVKMSDDQIDTVVRIDETTAPTVSQTNYKDTLLKFAAANRSGTKLLQLVEAPKTIMRCRFADIVFSQGDAGLQIALLNEEPGLSLLMAKTIESINHKVSQNAIMLKSADNQGTPVKPDIHTQTLTAEPTQQPIMRP